MTTPEDISRRFWNQAQKGDEEDRREQLFMDDIIQKAHLDREHDVAGVGPACALGHHARPPYGISLSR